MEFQNQYFQPLHYSALLRVKNGVEFSLKYFLITQIRVDFLDTEVAHVPFSHFKKSLYSLMPNILMEKLFSRSFVVQLPWIHQNFYPWTGHQIHLFRTCYVNSIVSSLWLVLKEYEECFLFSRILQGTQTNKQTKIP